MSKEKSSSKTSVPKPSASVAAGILPTNAEDQGEDLLGGDESHSDDARTALGGLTLGSHGDPIANQENEAAAAPVGVPAVSSFTLAAEDEAIRRADRPNADSQMSLFQFLTKSDTDPWQEKDIPTKANLFLRLCANQEIANAQLWKSRVGATEAFLIGIRKFRKDSMIRNTNMQAINLYLMMMLKQLRSSSPNEKGYLKASLLETLPVDQDPEFLLKGLEELQAKEKNLSNGDPLKEVTMSFVTKLTQASNSKIQPKDMLKMLTDYFKSAVTLVSKVDFFEEFHLNMSKDTDTNVYRLYVKILGQLDILKDGTRSSAKEGSSIRC